MTTETPTGYLPAPGGLRGPLSGAQHASAADRFSCARAAVVTYVARKKEVQERSVELMTKETTTPHLSVYSVQFPVIRYCDCTTAAKYNSPRFLL